MSDNAELRLRIAKAKGYVFAYVTPSHRGRLYPYSPGEIAVAGSPLAEDIADGHEAEIAWGGTPNWPNDIAAAWELVEEAQAEPYEQAFQINRTVAISSRWSCHVGNYHAYGATAPEAICRAYLAWMENKGG
jgi:hypothetical protein